MAKRIYNTYRFTQEYFDNYANYYRHSNGVDRLNTAWKGYLNADGYVYVARRQDSKVCNWPVEQKYVIRVKTAKPTVIISL